MAGAAGIATVAVPLSRLVGAQDANNARVIVIGGGFAGATCARYLRRYDPTLGVTMIEPQTVYHTCPMSNAVIGGLRSMGFLAAELTDLATMGVRVVHDEVRSVDPAGRKVELAGGEALTYDKLVVAPGIDFKWGAIEGYDDAASEVMPHAYKAGAQTELLIRQLHAMPDDGVVLLSAPENPFRCPPGPYERASMIAHYLKANKKRAKLRILDAKDRFAKQGLFEAAWQEHYANIIEWVPAEAGGAVVKVDPKSMTVETSDLKKHKGHVINVIPPQKAGAIASLMGLTGGGDWCPVNPRTFESKAHKGIYVIGDASIAGRMPKSGFAANSQAKVCAAAIVCELNGLSMPEPSYANTCYSLITPEHAISVASVYRLGAAGIVGIAGAGGTSPEDADAAFRKREAEYAFSWYANIRRDTFG